MTRSKEFRRIEQAIEHRDEGELRWALSAIETRKKFVKMAGHKWSHGLHRIEQRIRRALQEIEDARADS